MPPIIPRDQLLKKILGKLVTNIPGFDPQNVKTSLAILEFANRCVTSYEAHFARDG